MQHNAYTHGGTIGMGNNVNANDFPNSHVSNNGHVSNAIETSLPQNNNNSNNSSVVATAATIPSRGIETGAVSKNDVTSIGGNAGISAVNYGSTFFGNEYHHQLTQTALMANTTTYAAAASSAASTAMLTNYCDAAMMMAAAAVNANQCLQQQQQRMALMANCQTALAVSGSNNDEHDVAHLNKTSSPINNDMNHNVNQRSHNINSSLVSAALSSASSTTSNTSSSSSLLSSHPSSATTSPSITLVNTSSLISANVVSNDMPVGHLQPLQTHYHNHQLHLHHIEPPVTSPNLINISEVPLVVDVK